MGLLDWLRGTRSGGGETSVRVRAVLEPKVLYASAKARDLASLEDALRTGAGDGSACMCPGTLLFEFEGARPAITLHHGTSLRWDGSNGNLPLIRPDAIMDWLSERGIGFVREEFEADKRRGAQDAIEIERWRAIMPASLLPFFEDMRSTGADERPEWKGAIEAELPDPKARARVLLELFGSGRGPWTGFPSWEGVPEKLLLELPLDVLLSAIGDASSERIREGAARLFSSWWFGRSRAAERAQIPAGLRRILLDHVMASSDEDKRARARSALS